MESRAAHELITGVYDISAGLAEWDSWLQDLADFVNARAVALVRSCAGDATALAYEIDETTSLQISMQRNCDIEAEKVALLLPHIRRAWSLREHPRALDARHRSFAERLAAVLGLGVAILRNCEMLFANASARDSLKIAGLLDVDEGRLRLTGSKPREKLSRAIRRAETSVRSELLVFGEARAPIYLLCQRLHGRPAGHPGRPVVDIMLYCTHHSHATGLQPLRIAYLCARYQLSDKESRLAAGLAAGKRLNDLAAEFHVSVHTLRVQLKSVFRKTGTHRQAALVDLVVRQAPELFNLGSSAS